MDGLDVVRAAVRWIHAIAAVAWVGGSIFYLAVLRPALADGSPSGRPMDAAINKGFRDVVDLSIIALIVTGVVITFDRLSSAPITATYYVVLGLKIATALGMFFLARDLGTRLGRLLSPRRARANGASEPSLQESPVRSTTLRRWLSPSRMVLLLGLIAFFLSMLLVMVFENDVSGA